MFNLLNENWEKLDKKIENLDSAINFASGLFNSFNPYKWKEIFDLCEEIHQDFKTIRYPTKELRSIAWQKFFDLRDKAFQEKNKQIKGLSSTRKNEIYDMLQYTEYDWLGDLLIGKILSFGLLETKVEDMKWAGSKLKEAGAYFKSVKLEMTREDKAEVFLRISDIRSSHNLFWSRYKEISQVNYERVKIEREKARQEKQRDWEDKQEKSRRIKNRIENNISKNKENLNKATKALEKIKDSRRNLRDKISESYSDNWKRKAEGWLDEMDDKINDIEASVERIRSWIAEDQNKLDNWN